MGGLPATRAPSRSILTPRDSRWLDAVHGTGGPADDRAGRFLGVRHVQNRGGTDLDSLRWRVQTQDRPWTRMEQQAHRPSPLRGDV